MVRNLLLATAALSAAASCGGGGDEEPQDPNKIGRGTLTIESPTTEPAYKASPTANTAPLSGTAFNTAFLIKCQAGGTYTGKDTGVTITWSNSAGGSGTASQTVGCCGIGVDGFLCDHHNSVGHHSWSASVPIVAGTNVITVTGTDTAGNLGRDTITVTR